ncbi:MAG: Bor family protein [Paludibacteraceae bacterium]|nr:Bor family protein [Paludibacteraceae bacterium]
MTTRTYSKGYKETVGQEYKLDNAKQCYLFWGLLPIGKAKVQVPENQPYQVRTSMRFIDGLVTAITGGLFDMQTVTVFGKSSAAPTSDSGK